MAWEKVTDLYSADQAIYPVTFDFTKYKYRVIRTSGQMEYTTAIGRYGPGSVFLDYVVNVPGNQNTATITASNITGGSQHLLGFTDGFSIGYLERELINTAPTTPGAFREPTGDLEIGDTKAIAWFSASDAESNLSGYTLEVSINGGGYTQIATPTQPTFNYTIPTATSLKFRVKSRDSNGLESAYRESATFTVTKPK